MVHCVNLCELNRDPYIIHLNMVVSLYFGGKSHVSNGQNVSFKEPCQSSVNILAWRLLFLDAASTHREWRRDPVDVPESARLRTIGDLFGKIDGPGR